jgi:hypothetical protein
VETKPTRTFLFQEGNQRRILDASVFCQRTGHSPRHHRSVTWWYALDWPAQKGHCSEGLPSGSHAPPLTCRHISVAWPNEGGPRPSLPPAAPWPAVLPGRANKVVCSIRQSNCTAQINRLGVWATPGLIETRRGCGPPC